VMERGLSQSALLASAPATGSWGRKQGYSKKAFRPNREGQIHPVADAQRHLLGSKGTRRTSSALAIPAMDSSGSGGAQMKNIQNLSVNPFNSRPNTRVATRDGVNATSMRPPSGRLVPPLAPLRAATPAASQKVSEWMSRSGAVGSKARHFKDDDDVQSVRSGASGYSYSSGTSLQSYSDCTERTRSRRTAGSHATRSGLGSSVSRNSEARLTRLEAILNEERQKRLEAEKEIAELKQQVGR